jgi:hypothetical protein
MTTNNQLDKIEEIMANNEPDITSYKKVLINAIESTTIHGLPMILKEKNYFSKIIWLILFLSSFSFCLFLNRKSIDDFLNYEVITKARIINEPKLTFPTVTICNKNRFSTDAAVDFMRKVINDNNLEDIFDEEKFLNNKNLGFLDKRRKVRGVQDTARLILEKMPSNELRKSLSLSIEKMLIDCRFGGKECTKSDFDPFFITQHGICYRFNSDDNYLNSNKKVKQLYKTGWRNGLRLDLYIGLPTLLNRLALDKGVFLYIHSTRDFQPKEIHINPATETSIAVKKSIYEQLPYPYSNCSSHESIVDPYVLNLISYLNYSYSQEMCIEMCYLINLKAKCNCTQNWNNFKFPDQNVSLCLDKQQQNCDTNFYKNEFITDDYIIQNCNCPLECKKVIYDTFITNSKYPTKFYTDALRNDQSFVKRFSNSTRFDDLEQDLLRINIYFDSLSYLEISESESVSLIMLISDIGGTLGLFLGMSLLSIIETVDIIFKLIGLILNQMFKRHSKVNFEN